MCKQNINRIQYFNIWPSHTEKMRLLEVLPELAVCTKCVCLVNRFSMNVLLFVKKRKERKETSLLLFWSCIIVLQNWFKGYSPAAFRGSKGRQEAGAEPASMDNNSLEGRVELWDPVFYRYWWMSCSKRTESCLEPPVSKDLFLAL